VTKPDPSLLDDVVASKVLEAMKTASRALQALEIRHVVVGGLAVGANGNPRATKDVDFLVGDEAFEHHDGGFVTMKPGVPIQVNGVAIDLLSVQAGEDHLATALAAPMGSMIEAPQLVYMKLKSPRQKDRVDVIELVKAGIEIVACRAYLARHAPSLSAAFEEAVAKAASEE
jgi:intracellular sulfur oxidation DsrE/DsrF family protein